MDGGTPHLSMMSFGVVPSCGVHHGTVVVDQKVASMPRVCVNEFGLSVMRHQFVEQLGSITLMPGSRSTNGPSTQSI